MSTPTIGTLLNLTHRAQKRTLRADEARRLHDGITALDNRARADHLRAKLHRADTLATRYAAALHAIDRDCQHYQRERPTTATISAVLDAIRHTLSAALAQETQ